jgi:hypothetical protein
LTSFLIGRLSQEIESVEQKMAELDRPVPPEPREVAIGTGPDATSGLDGPLEGSCAPLITG